MSAGSNRWGREGSSRVPVAAIIVAAGLGRRMDSGRVACPPSHGRTRAKQFLLLAGRPILSHVIDRFEAVPQIEEIVVMVPPGEESFCADEVVQPFGFRKVMRILPGGPERQASVALGLAAISDGIELVAVHDGVRPCVTPEQIAAVIAAAVEADGAVLAIPLRDTPKQVGEDRMIRQTLPRREIWLAQTPQVFHRTTLQAAYARAAADGFSGTDDAALVERLGYRVAVVEGSAMNLKITTPEDLPVAEQWLASANLVHGANRHRL
jgi:2-C-methyl-D-erythritol 4-phosphate cytidylyltransferase